MSKCTYFSLIALNRQEKKNMFIRTMFGWKKVRNKRYDENKINYYVPTNSKS